MCSVNVSVTRLGKLSPPGSDGSVKFVDSGGSISVATFIVSIGKPVSRNE